MKFQLLMNRQQKMVIYICNSASSSQSDRICGSIPPSTKPALEMYLLAWALRVMIPTMFRKMHKSIVIVRIKNLLFFVCHADLRLWLDQPNWNLVEYCLFAVTLASYQIPLHSSLCHLLIFVPPDYSSYKNPSV